MKIFVFSILSVLFLFSCKKENQWDCIKGTGDVITEERELGAFSKIMLYDNIDLTFVDTNFNKAVIKAGSKLIPLIKSEIEGDALILSNDNKCNMVRDYSIPVEITVYGSSITNITSGGHGNIKSLNTIKKEKFGFDFFKGSNIVNIRIQTDTFYCATHSGAPIVSVNGVSHSAFPYSISYAVYHFEDLEVENYFINDGGSGDFFIHASNEINADMRTEGDVYYSGNATLKEIKITGPGQLIKTD